MNDVIDVSNNLFNGTETNCCKLELLAKTASIKPILKPENSGSTLYCVDSKSSFIWYIDDWYPV